MRMPRPFGSMLAEAGEITLSTADHVQVRLKNGFVERAALRIFGVPHMGMRMRMNRISSLLPDVSGEMVLDAGCGPGLHALFLSERRAGAVVGVDVDRKKVLSAAAIAGRTGVKNSASLVGDVTRLPFGNCQFDLVLCSDVLEHVKDDGKALSEFGRVLRRTGILVVTVPTGMLGAESHGVFGHVRPGYDFAGIEGKLSKAGFAVERWEYYMKPFGHAAWRLNRFFFRSRVLTALTFYPLYLLSKLDGILPRSHAGSGLAVKACKAEST